LPADAQKIIELTCILDASDVGWRPSLDELTHDGHPVGPQQPKGLGKHRDDLFHALLLRKARFEVKHSTVDPLQGLIEWRVCFVAEYGAAARQIFQQPNLSIQKTHGHGCSRNIGRRFAPGYA
jgi:hypothetical protein